MDPKKAMLAKKHVPALSPECALSTGSTLLNLACSDHSRCGFIKGRYYYLVGDSTSGKTWLSMTCFAESQINKSFSEHKLIFDDVEDGAMMDIEGYFGKAVAQKMERVVSDSIQDFYDRLEDLIEAGEPFIYVLDSQDALDSQAAKKKRAEQKKARQKGNKEKGSFGMDKPKVHSENIRWVLSGLRKTNSILIIIGQTRDNIDPMAFEKRTRSGGKALKFYATIEIWTSVGKKIKKDVRGIKRTVGVNCIAEVRKNRVTGKVGRDRSVEIPIYNDYGIDDIGSCIDFMVKNKGWVKKGGKIHWNGELFSRQELIKVIEEQGREREVQKIVGKLWRTIENECKMKGRKKRYE